MKKKKPIIPIILIIVVIFLILISCGASPSNSTSISETKTQESSVFETTAMSKAESSSAESTSVEETTTVVKSNDTSALDFYKDMQDSGIVDFKLNYAASEFLKNHADIFPTDNLQNISSETVDYSIVHENISKAPDKYGDKLIYVDSLKIVQIREQTYSKGRFTWINACDSNNNYYTIYYRGTLPNINKGSTVNVYGLPLAYSSYDNTIGGSTLTVVLAGCNISLPGVNNTPISNGNTTPQNTPVSQPVVQDNSSEYILPDSSTKYYTIDDVNWLHSDEIRIAINEIYARHGRMFKSEELQNYFNSKSWYTPTTPADQFNDSVLNDCERHNIEVLQTIK